MKYGLDPTMSRSSLKAIFLSCDKNTALNYNDHHMTGDKYVILQIDGNGLDENFLGPDNYELQDILDNEDENSKYFNMKWHDLTWEESAKLVCQIAYYEKIQPKFIEVLPS